MKSHEWTKMLVEKQTTTKILISVRKIRSAPLETPYKIPLPLWLALLMRKFRRDSLTRATSVGMLKTLTNKRAGKLLKSKLTRETY